MKPSNFKNFMFCALIFGLMASCGVKQNFDTEIPQNDSELMATLNPCNEIIPKDLHHSITDELIKALSSSNVNIYSGASGYVASLVLGKCIFYAVFDRDGKIVTHYFVRQIQYVKSKVTGMTKLSGGAFSAALESMVKNLRVLPVIIIPDLKCDKPAIEQPLSFLCLITEGSIRL